MCNAQCAHLQTCIQCNAALALGSWWQQPSLESQLCSATPPSLSSVAFSSAGCQIQVRIASLLIATYMDDASTYPHAHAISMRALIIHSPTNASTPSGHIQICKTAFPHPHHTQTYSRSLTRTHSHSRLNRNSTNKGGRSVVSQDHNVEKVQGQSRCQMQTLNLPSFVYMFARRNLVNTITSKLEKNTKQKYCGFTTTSHKQSKQQANEHDSHTHTFLLHLAVVIALPCAQTSLMHCQAALHAREGRERGKTFTHSNTDELPFCPVTSVHFSITIERNTRPPLTRPTAATLIQCMHRTHSLTIDILVFHPRGAH